VFSFFFKQKDTDSRTRICSIRFSPPLVISEEDLQKAIGVIKQALIDLDEVCINSPPFPLLRVAHASLQLEDIPGEVESEKGFRDELTN
jgi:ornithine--oxo-acid transaminase